MTNYEAVSMAEPRFGGAPESAGRDGGKKRKTWLAVLVWALVLAGLGWLTLFLSYRIGEFNSIPHMLEFIARHLA